MWVAYLAVVTGVLVCSLSQLLLKTSARKKHRSPIFEVVNPYVMVSYLIFAAALVTNIWAMSRGVQLKEVALLESLGYVFVPLFAFLFLKESISKRTICAMLMILSGIIVFYL